MRIRAIPADICRELAPLNKVLSWVREAQIATSKGDVVLPLRRALVLDKGLGAIGMMPGYLGPAQSAGIKLVSLVPPERRKGSSHLGLFVLYDAEGLVPVALLDGSVITAIRTAAASAMATDILARGDASILSVIGTGEQAEAHIEAVALVRAFKEIRIWGRTQKNAVALCEKMSGRGYPCQVADSVSDATDGADVICTVTSSSEPIMFGDMINPGTHINLVGSSHPNSREVDTALLLKSKIFLDYEASARDQAGEILKAVDEGELEWSDIAGEIGAVLTGELKGRTDDEDITIYKSLGIASQDIITARRIYEAAEQAQSGTIISL